MENSVMGIISLIVAIILQIKILIYLFIYFYKKGWIRRRKNNTQFCLTRKFPQQTRFILRKINEPVYEMQLWSYKPCKMIQDYSIQNNSWLVVLKIWSCKQHYHYILFYNSATNNTNFWEIPSQQLRPSQNDFVKVNWNSSLSHEQHIYLIE